MAVLQANDTVHPVNTNNTNNKYFIVREDSLRQNNFNLSYVLQHRSINKQTTLTMKHTL